MSETWIQDRKAINYLERIVISLEWMWREQPILDYGIDGQIEICDQNKPTGKLIAVQSKGGESYFYRKKDGDLSISLTMRHLQYWNEYALPVIVIGHLPSEQLSYWIYIQEYLDSNSEILKSNQHTVSLHVPKTNLFDIGSKQLLLSIFDSYLERIVKVLFSKRNLDMDIIEQLDQIVKNSGIDHKNFEALFLSRMIAQGAPLQKSVALLAQRHNEAARNAILPLISDTEKYLANQYAWLAGAFLQENRYEEAKQFVDKAILINPHDYNALNIRGACYAQGGNIENAEADFQNAIKIAPNFSAPFVNKGKILFDSKNYKEAILMFDQAIEKFDRKSTAIRMKGDCYKHLNEYQQAITAYNRAIEINEKDADAWKGLGDIYGSQGKFDLSISAYTKAIKSDPNYIRPLINRGFAKYHSGDHIGAKIDFNQVLIVDPNNEYALKGLKRIDNVYNCSDLQT